MALIELYCPRCGGEVRMDQSMMFGTCLNCGARCLLQEMVPRRTEVTVEGTPTVDGLVDLALRMWTIGDEDSAYRAVGDALRQSPEDVRAWILRGLMDDADVSSALGDSMLDPARDLDFCLAVLNRRPDAIRWISGRMDHGASPDTAWGLVRSYSPFSTTSSTPDTRGSSGSSWNR